jgi:hypothetical protein
MTRRSFDDKQLNTIKHKENFCRKMKVLNTRGNTKPLTQLIAKAVGSTSYPEYFVNV